MKRLLIILALLIAIMYVGTYYNILPSGGLLENALDATRPSDNLISDLKLKVVDEESARIKAIKKTIPSVVTVTIKKTETTGGRIEIDPFNPFNPFRRRPGKSESIERNIGSGFVISKGLIITNKHVVSDRDAQYTILTNNGKTLEVKEISRDPLNDLAILQVDGLDIKGLEMGNSDDLKLGQTVIAIGTPLGEFTNTVTVGIVSGLGRGITAGSAFEGFVEQLDNVIQTDAAINPGNSGGPLINLAGQIVGVNTAISQGSENIGFAIPVSVVKDLVEKFDPNTNSVQRPFLGVRYQIISRQSALLNEVPEGALIIDVVEGSGAKAAGLQTNDIITKFDGTKIAENSKPSLAKLVAAKKAGDRVKITIWRNGKTIQKTITLGLFE